MVARARSPYVPEAGDVIWLNFDPQAGREQAGRRPSVVLSPREYNRRTSLALVCPVTTRVKGYPFEVPLPTGMAISGVVLADQVRSLDWEDRQAALVARVPEATLAEIRARLRPLMGD